MACTFPPALPVGLEAHCYSNVILLLFAVSFLNTPSFLHVGNSVTREDALGIHCIPILAENHSRPSNWEKVRRSLPLLETPSSRNYGCRGLASWWGVGPAPPISTGSGSSGVSCIHPAESTFKLSRGFAL